MSEEKRGRPSVYTRETANYIIDELTKGRTLNDICREEGMPASATVREWALNDRDGFSARYATAREIGYHVMADEIIDISDNGTNDWMARNDPSNPGYLANGEALGRSRLRVDTRKWMLAKVLPKIYGDRVAIGGVPGEPIEHKDVTEMSDEDLMARLDAIEKRVRGG